MKARRLTTGSGQEDWAPCEPWGYSWWPVAQINLNVEHNSQQLVGNLLTGVKIYACWYQILCHDTWKGPENFWIEAWSVRGHEYRMGGAMDPATARRHLAAWGDLSADIARQNTNRGARYTSANDTEDTPQQGMDEVPDWTA